MNAQPWASLGACLLACLFCVAAGRLTAPKPAPEVRIDTREAVRYYEAQTWRADTWRATTASSEKAAATATRTKRREYNCPDGRLSAEEEEETATAATEKAASVENVATTSEGKTWVSETRAVESKAETKATNPPRFALGVGPSFSFSRPSAGPNGLAASAGLRVVGPLWLTTTATRVSGETSAALMVGVQW